MDKMYFSTLTSTIKSMEGVNTEERFFEGLLTVQMKDKQGEVTIVDELYKVLPTWMDRGAPITDTHSNRVIGKGINYALTNAKNAEGDILPAIKITGKIYKNYELDDLIWSKIKNGEYKGLSFGGATRSQREPMRMKDGSMAYALKDLEHYEVAVCKDPAVPMAIITDINSIAKAQFDAKDRGDGKMVIKCTKMGCYVEKADLSEEDTFESKVQKLMSEGKSRESAEKIVGSFVKGEKTKRYGAELYIPKRGHKVEKNPDAENKDDQVLSEINERTKDDDDEKDKERDHADSDGDQHSMYNQDVGRDTSSGRKTENRHLNPSMTKADTTAQQQGGVRNDISGINQQGSLDPTDSSGQITRVKEDKDDDEKETDKDKESFPAERQEERNRPYSTKKSSLSGLL